MSREVVLQVDFQATAPETLNVRTILRRQRAVDGLIVEDRQAELLQVVDALHPPRRLPRSLHGGQQQGDEHRNDRD